MNTGHDLEKLLGRLSPAVPSADLMARLRAARPPEKKPHAIVRFALPTAAAASLAAAWLLHRPALPPTPAAKEPELQPVGSVQHLMEVADLGVVMGKDEQPVRLILTRWIDEIVYAPSGGGEPVKEGRVREEVLPVSLDLY